MLTVRPAVAADARAIARMVDMASDGHASWFWGSIAEPGEDALEVGERHSASDDSDHSWRRSLIAEIDGEMAGGLSGYRLPDVPPPPIDEPNPMMQAVRRLEARAPGTQYIYQVATFPDFRRRGVARALLGATERLAEGARGLSVLVTEGNLAASLLYRSAGFVAVAREPVPTHDGWEGEAGVLVLMLKPPG